MGGLGDGVGDAVAVGVLGVGDGVGDRAAGVRCAGRGGEVGAAFAVLPDMRLSTAAGTGPDSTLHA